MKPYDPSEQRPRGGSGNEFQRWLWFVCLVSIAPAVASIFIISITNIKLLDMAHVFGKGDMAISGLALAADATGGLVGKELAGYRFGLLGICFLMALFSCLLIGTIVASESATGSLVVAYLSLGAFAFCFLASLAVKLTGE